MATSQTLKSSAPILPVVHLVFTLLSIATLSYKVFHLESELSLLREELSIRDRNDGSKTNLPLFATSASKFGNRSDRNRRLSDESGRYTIRQKIQEAVCVRKALNDFQVRSMHEV